MTTPASRVTDLGRKLRLVLLVTLASSHLRRENARCDGVDADLAVLKSGRQHAADVGQSRLGRCVGELAVAGTFHLAADGTDVYDLGCVAGRDVAALGEEG